MYVENPVINQLLTIKSINQEEYNILFESKEKLYTDTDTKKFETFKKEVDFFNITLQKIIKLQNNEINLILDFIKFPYFHYKDFIFNDNQSISFKYTEFSGEANFFAAIIPKKINFDGAKFNGIAYFRDSNFYGTSSFLDTKFYEKVSFFNTIFSSDCSFVGTKFNDEITFYNANFYQKAIFWGTTFKEMVDFTEISFNKLNLTVVRLNNASFLKLSGYNNLQKTPLNKKNFENKESARLIKAHFEKQNNITEANKYFQIEQELYIDHIITTKTEPNRIATLSVLYLNKFVSNFGTDWIRPLLVIFIFGYLSSFGFALLQNGTESINFTNSKLLLFGAFSYSLLVYYFYHKKLWVALIASILVFSSLLLGDSHLREISNDISKLINPLNIFKPKANYFENIAIYGMLVKLGMATLIYQFIVAFRQNTRRK